MSGDAGESRATPIRVLHVLPDLAMGGGQQVLLRHLRAMPRDAVENQVVHFGTALELEPAFRQAGASVHRIPYHSLASWPRAFHRLRALARELRVDLIHTNGTPVDKLNGQLLALVARLPLVTTLHGVRPRPGRQSLRPRALLRRLAFASGRRLEALLDRRTVRRFIAVSDAVREDWSAYLDGRRIPRERVDVVYSGVPVSEFAHPDAGRCAALRDQLGLRGRRAVLIAICRLQKSKNVHLLVPIVQQLRAQLPEVVLLVVGSGDEAAALQADVRRAGLEQNVQLLGQRTDVAELLAVSHVLLFPSPQEGFGLVALEALAGARPVVSARLPSLARLARQSAAIRFVERVDAPAFAAAALELLNDAALRETIGREGQAIVARDWRVEDSAARYVQIYRAVAGRPAPG